MVGVTIKRSSRDPSDLAAFGAAVTGLLTDPARARRISLAARERVRAEFLGPHHLALYMRLIEKLVTGADKG